MADEDRGLAKQGVAVSDEAFEHLVEVAGGDARVALTGLEASVLAARSAGRTRSPVSARPTRFRRRRSSTTDRVTRTTT